ncbi:hypothetical protein GALMADRAFT_210667 [Galerina marginata CBS 339.88]|uniref:Uncharacterized protein n=1 Tax=Galerina marginata (strain CBS 339.88) TaxID=685588 RepID=A0A067TA89_GALM3|nr:hypothetical protein GALMADRAFT_210667 [Galerina marginata CBS 339.88]
MPIIQQDQNLPSLVFFLLPAIMKLFVTLALIASNFVIRTLAVDPEGSEPLTVRQSTSTSTSEIMAPFIAQFWQTGISGFEQYSPSAAPGIIAAMEQACTTFNTIDTQGAELPQTNTFTYLLAPAFVSLWGSLFRDVNTLFPLLPAGISVLMGNTSSIPALVTAAQAACELIQNGGVEPRTIVPPEAKRGFLGSLVGRTLKLIPLSGHDNEINTVFSRIFFYVGFSESIIFSDLKAAGVTVDVQAISNSGPNEAMDWGRMDAVKGLKVNAKDEVCD